MLHKWNQMYLDVVTKHVHKKSITIRPSEPKWFTPEIRNLIRRRNRIHRKAKSKDSPQIWEKYRKIRNETISKISEAKENFNKSKADEIKTSRNHNPKQWWKLVKDFFNNSGSSSLNNPLIVDGQVLNDNYEKACALNNFFANQTILDSQNTSLPPPKDDVDKYLININIPASLVKDILDILKTNKSTCPDDLSPLVLKNTSKAIAPILAKLYNFSLRSSVFPDQWKLASVTAIFKKEDRTACKNYRPICHAYQRSLKDVSLKKFLTFSTAIN